MFIRQLFFCGDAARYRQFLDCVAPAVPAPCRCLIERGKVRSLESVFQPFAVRALKGDDHAGFVVGDVQSGHGIQSFRKVGISGHIPFLRHVEETAAASTAAGGHQVAVLLTPYVQCVAADIHLVFQDDRPRIVKIHVRSGQTVIASVPVVAVFAVCYYACKHFQAFYIDDFHHICAVSGIHRPTFHNAVEPCRRAFHGGLGRAFILSGGRIGLARRLVGCGSCGIGGVLGFRGRTGRCIGCLGGRICGLRGGVGRGSRISSGFLEQRHRYVYQFVPFHARQGVHPVQAVHRFQFLHALALRLDGVEHLLYVVLCNGHGYFSLYSLYFGRFFR